MSDNCSQVPSFIQGHVVGPVGPNICQDGALFYFQEAITGRILRIKPTNDTARAALERALERGQEVVIGGYFCRGVEVHCMRFDCYVVIKSHEFADKAKSLG